MTNIRFTVPTTRYMLFTGKGGVGKTSLSCATAVLLAQGGERTLIVSTDPASNLDEVLGMTLTGEPLAIPAAHGLFAMNIDPNAAAARYRERAVGPFRGALPAAALRSIEESLSGACTTEIAAFDEFTNLFADASVDDHFDRIVFDTAPTGHTLRLLSLPAAWSSFIDTNTSGMSCMGPLAALEKHEASYRAAVEALQDASRTTIVLVARADQSCIREAARASRELRELGIGNQRLILNGLYDASDSQDEVAVAFAGRQANALRVLPSDIAGLPTSFVPLIPMAVLGIEGLRGLFAPSPLPKTGPPVRASDLGDLDSIINEIAKSGNGVVMTMGKGGVGKTTIAAAISGELARRGCRTVLTTTDPAGHVPEGSDHPNGLLVERIDPKREVARYSEEVLASLGKDLGTEERALLEEDLRSPCTEEIAVFRAFADTIARGNQGFVVVDTAPTGHTILLLDAAEAYHREVLRGSAGTPESVTELLQRLRDPDYTKVIVIALPEPTPVHEAAALATDLRRAGIEPFAAIVNQSLAASGTLEPLLACKAAQEADSIEEARALAPRFAVLPWSSSGVSVRPLALR